MKMPLRCGYNRGIMPAKGALASVPDNYRKIVLSMYGFDFSRDGIEHVHLPGFLLDDKV